MQDQLKTVQQVAERLQVHQETVRKWLRDGELVGINLGGKSGWRIREREIEAFLERREEQSKSLAEGEPGEAGSPSPAGTGEAALMVAHA
jgi:excisionase family DNA binding protein